MEVYGNPSKSYGFSPLHEAPIEKGGIVGDTKMVDIRITLPTKHLVNLHSMELLMGKSPDEAISEALDAYFETKNLEKPKDETP